MANGLNGLFGTVVYFFVNLGQTFMAIVDSFLVIFNQEFTVLGFTGSLLDIALGVGLPVLIIFLVIKRIYA